MMRLPTALFFSLVATTAAAQEPDLLPVEQAFALSASAPSRETVKFEWKIADGYYLYRNKVKVKPGAGMTAGALDLPAGEKKHDEFLGDVEVYHHSASAAQAFTLADANAQSVELTVIVQGCHELEPKICYPPHPEKLTLALPTPVGNTTGALRDAATAAGAAPNPLKNALGKLGGDAGAANMDAANTGAEALPLPPEQAFRFETIAASPTELLARWTMPKGYYLYRDKTVLRVDGGSGVTLGALRWPKGVPHKDEHFGDVTVFFDQVELPITLARRSGSDGTLALGAEFQGCENGGVCYPLMTRSLKVDLPAATPSQLSAAAALVAQQLATSPASSSASVAGAIPNATVPNEQSEEQRLAANLSGNRLWALLSFFGFGLLLAFTPCVFPMIPILSGIIAGAGDNVSTRRAFVLSLVYVLASTVVFTIAGVIAGLAGANLQAAFQQPWILWSFAALFVLLALSMFGFFELQLPSSLQNRITAVSNKQEGGSLLGVAIMGFLSTLIVGPCVAPPLAGAVLYISEKGDPWFGGLALFVLSLGMGAPLVLAGTAAGKLLPRAGAWMDAVKAVFGVSFLGLAVWMLSRILDAGWIMLMTGALAVASAVYLGALDRLADDASGWKKLWKALGVLLLILGAAELIGAAAGSRDLLQPLRGLGGGAAVETHLTFRTIKSSADLDREVAAGKPVLLDFYADWCVSCKEMEKFTFTKPEVAQALAGFTLLKADVTANDDIDQALLKRFNLFGPPATIFFGSDGMEKRALRLIGFEEAGKFVARASKAH